MGRYKKLLVQGFRPGGGENEGYVALVLHSPDAMPVEFQVKTADASVLAELIQGEAGASG